MSQDTNTDTNVSLLDRLEMIINDVSEIVEHSIALVANVTRLITVDIVNMRKRLNG